MANVRIDENGLPKGPVVEQQAPVAHRSGVTGPDAGDPASPSLGVAAEGFGVVDFDLDVALGGGDPLLEVAPLFYDPTAGAWFRGESAFFVESGRYRLRAEARGAVAYLQVVSLTGTAPTLALDAWAVAS